MPALHDVKRLAGHDETRLARQSIPPREGQGTLAMSASELAAPALHGGICAAHRNRPVP
jgi:hypothetical protein